MLTTFCTIFEQQNVRKHFWTKEFKKTFSNNKVSNDIFEQNLLDNSKWNCEKLGKSKLQPFSNTFYRSFEDFFEHIFRS